MKSWTQLSNFTFIFHFYALEKEIETHSGILAWKIPWMEEPVRLQSMGLQRVRDITLPTKVHLVRLWFFQ